MLRAVYVCFPVFGGMFSLLFVVNMPNVYQFLVVQVAEVAGDVSFNHYRVDPERRHPLVSRACLRPRRLRRDSMEYLFQRLYEAGAIHRFIDSRVASAYRQRIRLPRKIAIAMPWHESCAVLR